MSAVAETALIAKLKATSSVTTLVGQRVFPRIAPEGADKPYIVVQRPPGEKRKQQTNKRSKFVQTPMSLACVGSTYESSRAVSDAVVDAVNPTSAWTGSATWGTLAVDHCSVVETYDRSGNPQLADEIGFPVEFVEVDLFYVTA